MKTINFSIVSVLSLLIIFSFVLIQPKGAEAAESCAFDRSLEIGMDGEDVRCLQKYLNSAGFTIASAGPGSPGNETSLFRDATKSAVIKWQEANGLSPAIGFFGPLSRAKYSDFISGNAGGEVLGANTSSGNESQVAELLNKLNALQAQLDTAKTQQNTVNSDEVSKELLKAANELKKAENQVEDALDDGLNIGRADENIIDARDDFYDAVIAFLGNNFERALSFASYSIENSLDAFEDAGGKTESDEIDEFLEDLEDEIDDAWETIENEKDNGKNIDRAEEILEDAEDLLDEAQDKLKDNEVDEARELGEDVEDMIDDALDSVSDNDERDAEEAIDDAADAIDDAWDDVRDADRDGKDVDDAEDILRDAEDALDDAQDAYDDGDYDEAVERAEEAEDLADEALDEI